MAIKVLGTTVIDDDRNLTNINSLSQATWEAGTSTTETVVSPAKLKAAIDANGGAVTADDMSGSVAGDTVLFGTGGTGVVFELGSSTTGFVDAAAFKAITDCEIRVKAETRVNRSPAGIFKIFKNGTEVLTQSISTSWTAVAVDITLSAGDMVRVGGSGGEDISDSSTLRIRDITYNTTSGQRSVGGI